MDPKQAQKSQQQYEASIEILKSLQVSIQAEQQRYQTFAARLSKIATPRTQYDSQLAENESVLQVCIQTTLTSTRALPTCRIGTHLMMTFLAPRDTLLVHSSGARAS